MKTENKYWIKDLCIVKKPRSIGATTTLSDKKTEWIKFETFSELVDFLISSPEDVLSNLTEYIENKYECSFKDMCYSELSTGGINIIQFSNIISKCK